MAIEGISGAGMTYQGSTSNAQVKEETQPRVDAAEVQITSENISKNTTDITTKNPFGNGEDSQDGGNHELAAEARQTMIQKAVEDINKRANDSEAVFGIHEGTNRVTIKIVDKKTKEVIKELPPEKTLDMIAKVWEMAGIMVDEKR